MYFLCKTIEKGTQAGWGGSRCYPLTETLLRKRGDTYFILTPQFRKTP